MDNDAQKYQYEALNWLFEMELLNHPQLINNLKMRVLVVSKNIREVEFLMDRENKKILTYLDLNWFAHHFQKQRIFQETEATITQLLPSFRVRVIDDSDLMNLAVEKVKRALGGSRESIKTTSGGNADSSSNSQPSGGNS